MNRPLSTIPGVETPTRVRYGVLGFACSLSMITYLDRVCIASVAPNIVQALGLQSVADMGLAFTAFALAYAIFEIPTGWLGDVYGPRSALIRIVLWWSVFTALTGLVGLSFGGVMIGFTALVIIRFLFGMGEAGAYPNITRALHNWFPFQQRGFGQGAVWMSGRLMGGLTPFLMMVLLVGITRTVTLANGETQEEVLLSPLLHWRASFWVFGGLGIVWSVLFYVWFRNRPEEKATVNEAERQLIVAGRVGEEGAHSGVPWMKLLTSGNLWTLCLMYFCAAYGWYFNITYLPTFLEEQHGVSRSSLIGSLYKGGPLWLGAVACLGGGFLTDWFIRRTGNRKWGRRLFGVVGHSLCSLCYLACLLTDSAFTFFIAISFAAFFNDLTMGAAWATCQDIGKRYAAIVAGAMNTIGNLGGAVAGYVTSLILNAKLEAHAAALDTTVKQMTAAEKAAGLLPGYHINFLTFAAVYFVAVLFWLRVDATRPVAPMEDH